MLGFAIVGCGMIARFHARALADVPNTKIVALVSRSAESARKMKDELNLSCDLATELGEVVKRKDVDVVIITTPSGRPSGARDPCRQCEEACRCREAARNHLGPLRRHH